MSSIKSTLRAVLFAPLHPVVLRPLLNLGRSLGLLPARHAAAGEPRRILVANLTPYLGDGVMMMPFLQHLRRVYPSAHIDLITTSALGPLFSPLPMLDSVHCLPRAITTLPVWSIYRRMLQMLKFVRNLPTCDVCFLPRWGTDPGMSAWIALFVGVPDVRGYDPREDTYGHTPVPGVRHILTAATIGGQHLQEAMRELRLLEATGASEPLDYHMERQALVQPLLSLEQSVDVPALFHRLGLNPSQPFLALCPGASSPARRWPAERFAQVATELYRRISVPSLILGGPADAFISAAVHRAAPGVTLDLTGSTSLPELAVLLSKATLLLANDSGPAHVGAGVGTPTLVLSACPAGSTVEHAGSPARVSPVGPSVHVLQPESAAIFCIDRCAHTEAHCILTLTVDQVLHAATPLLLAQVRVRAIPRNTLAGAPAATL